MPALALQYFSANTTIDLKAPCLNCTAGDICNLTVLDPSNSIVIDNEPMTQANAVYQNYTTNQTSSLGIYSALMNCNDTNLTNLAFTFGISIVGNTPPGDGMNIFMMLVFVALLAGLIWSLIKIGEDLASMQMSWKDLALCYIFYFTAFVFYLFNKVYFNDLLITDMLTWMIDIGAFTNMVIPTMAAIFTWWMNIVTQRKIHRGGLD